MSKKICTNEFLNGSPILAAQNGEPIPLHATGTKQINLSNGHISTVLSLFLTACMLQKKKKTCIIETLVMAQLLNSCLVSPASLVLLKRNLCLHASFPLHHRRSLKDANTDALGGALRLVLTRCFQVLLLKGTQKLGEFVDTKGQTPF